LIVDDDANGCEPLAMALERWGYQSTCVANGREALRMLSGTKWDAVLVDIRMPEMDGMKLLEVMRSYLRWHALPVIVLTAEAVPDQLREVRELGVAHIFHKTMYTLDELRQALDEVTGGLIAPGD
jgi:CheY-like chemotaxis protein